MLRKFKEKLSQKGDVYLRVKVQPSSSSNEIKSIMDDETIKISISAPPENNKANIQLIKILAKEFSVDKKYVKLISGATNKIKLIKITMPFG
jgi:uncharacterized protein